jgi:hypothetical protein
MVCDCVVEIGLTEEMTGLDSALTKPVLVKTMNIEENRIAIINPTSTALFIRDTYPFMGVLFDKTVLVKIY